MREKRQSFNNPEISYGVAYFDLYENLTSVSSSENTREQNGSFVM
jgi:hypothetical protein